MKILVIDDSAVLARSLRRMLKDDDVAIETDSPRALARVMSADLEGEPFDVVLCDLSMPTMDGLEVLAGLRALSNPPILVLMTGYDHIVENVLVDADGVLAKPFTCVEFYNLITQVKAR